MNVCQDRESGYRKNVARVINARCAEYKKKLELRGQGEGKIYVCPGTNCNFRERLIKKEVNNIMKKKQRLI